MEPGESAQGRWGGIAPHFQMKGVISDFSHKLKMAVAESVMGLNSLEFCPRKFVTTVSAPSISELYRHALGWSLGGGEACTLSPLISSVLFSQKILIRLKAKKLKMHKATQNAHRMKTRHTQHKTVKSSEQLVNKQDEKILED